MRSLLPSAKPGAKQWRSAPMSPTPDSVQALAAEAAERLGQLKILVNNAGITRQLLLR